MLGPSDDVDLSICITLWHIAPIATEAHDFSPPLGILCLHFADNPSSSRTILFF